MRKVMPIRTEEMEEKGMEEREEEAGLSWSWWMREL